MRRNHRRWGRGFFLKLLLVGVMGGVVWSYGLVRFAAAIPAAVADATSRTDGIVVLTGGSRRLGEGLDLLSRGLAEKLFVSGVYQGVDVRKLLGIAKRKPEDLETMINIGIATNTTGNAAETMDWMVRQKYSSLRLVTAAYHMPRSMLEFRNVMPTVTLIPHPVFPKNVKHKRWWAWPGTASLVISEYNKYLLAWTRLWVGRMIKKSGWRKFRTGTG
ncbi:MAG: YdcF family protein [Proteobacteria bacterium]|nr:YdcF family protein [Pseudomonadota bacterium]